MILKRFYQSVEALGAFAIRKVPTRLAPMVDEPEDPATRPLVPQVVPAEPVRGGCRRLLSVDLSSGSETMEFHGALIGGTVALRSRQKPGVVPALQTLDQIGNELEAAGVEHVGKLPRERMRSVEAAGVELLLRLTICI